MLFNPHYTTKFIWNCVLDIFPSALRESIVVTLLLHIIASYCPLMSSKLMLQRYKAAGEPTIVLAGAEYGSGSSRDWAAKGPMLLVS